MKISPSLRTATCVVILAAPGVWTDEFSGAHANLKRKLAVNVDVNVDASNNQATVVGNLRGDVQFPFPFPNPSPVTPNFQPQAEFSA